MSTILTTPPIPNGMPLTEWRHPPTWEKPATSDVIRLYEYDHPEIEKISIGGYSANISYLSTVGWGRRYFLIAWTCSRFNSNVVASKLRAKYQFFGFVVQKIPFSYGNETFERYGIYATKKILPRHPLASLIHKQSRYVIDMGW